MTTGEASQFSQIRALLTSVPSYHHARSGPAPSRPVSPWSPAASSSSSGSFTDTIRCRMLETGARYKKRALSADLLNNNNIGSRADIHKPKPESDHKISIYVTHKAERL